MFLRYSYRYNMRLRHSVFIGMLIALAWLVQADNVMAQQRAVVLSVRYGVVEMQRVGTRDWLPLRAGAVLPIVAGDSVRTGRNGRVHFDLRNGTELAMLQDSRLTLVTYGDIDNERSFEADVEGITVWRVQDPSGFTGFTIRATDFTLTQAAEHFAVWSLPEQHDTLAVAEGEAIAQVGTETYTLPQGQALWADLDNPQQIELEAPLNAARLEARLLGCRGIIETSQLRGVNVRRGIGQQQERLGLIPNQSEVYVLARNQANFWLRVQYLSAFSWIVKEAVRFDEANCPNLRVLPDNTPHERISGIMNPLPSEITLLKPFFNTPLDDTFFYQYE